MGDEFLYICKERVAVFPPHLCDPDEDLQLVDVELLIHAFSEPGPQKVHGGGVPLLKHINTTPSSKTHSGTDSSSSTTRYAVRQASTPPPEFSGIT